MRGSQSRTVEYLREPMYHISTVAVRFRHERHTTNVPMHRWRGL